MAKADREPSAVMSWMLKSKGLPVGKIKLLLSSREQISQAWDRDGCGSKGFPVNTANTVADLKARLKRKQPRKRVLLPQSKTAGRVGDVLTEKLIQQVHEYLYEQPLQDALHQLRSAETSEGARVRIGHSIDHAWRVATLGEEQLPAPRGNWLHRQLLGVVLAATPAKFTDSEMAELFNHFCPCGTIHNREAMKKFRWRHSLRSE